MRRNGKSRGVFGIGNMAIRATKGGYIASIFMDKLGLGHARKITRNQALAAIRAAERFVKDAKKVVR